jgi:RNase H-fold protein (predicted Holliday junction resolvase)
VRASDRRGQVDKVAACLLLQAFLDLRKQETVRKEPPPSRRE